MFEIDRHSPTPLADQIEARLAELIVSGRLPSGARLASIRQLASQLTVSAQTVVTAYDRLVAAGRIESRATAGFFVCEAPASLAQAAGLEAGEEHEPVWLAQQANDQPAGLLLASSGALPATWLQEAVPATSVQRALARSSAGLASRCPPQGLLELRERIAALMRGQGMAVDAGRIMTTFGATQAIDLILRAFVQPGEIVLVESPGYFLMYDRLRQQGLRAVPITRHPDGLDLAELEAACLRHRPRLLIVQSVLHNPTGWSSSPANLHRLLALAERHQLLIAEDDVHGHFHPGQAGPAARLAALSGLERVIYISSFCKAMSPALRVGWVAAEPALLKPLLREKILSVLTTAALNEFIVLEVLAAGRWRKHLERLQQRLLAARATSLRQLGAAGLRFASPGEGGLFLWARVPDGVDVDALVQAALQQHQIVLARGASFAPAPDSLVLPEREPDDTARHLRINVVAGQHPRLAAFLSPRLQTLRLPA